jgi:hypothetical protein
MEQKSKYNLYHVFVASHQVPDGKEYFILNREGTSLPESVRMSPADIEFANALHKEITNGGISNASDAPGKEADAAMKKAGIENSLYADIVRYIHENAPDTFARLARRVDDIALAVGNRKHGELIRFTLYNNRYKADLISYIRLTIFHKLKTNFVKALEHEESTRVGFGPEDRERFSKSFLESNIIKDARNYARVILMLNPLRYNRIMERWASSLARESDRLPNMMIAFMGACHGARVSDKKQELLYKLGHDNSPDTKHSYITQTFPELADAISRVASLFTGIVSKSPAFERIHYENPDRFLAATIQCKKMAMYILAGKLATLTQEQYGELDRLANEWRDAKDKWPYRPGNTQWPVLMLINMLRSSALSIIRDTLESV